MRYLPVYNTPTQTCASNLMEYAHVNIYKTPNNQKIFVCGRLYTTHHLIPTYNLSVCINLINAYRQVICRN